MMMNREQIDRAFRLLDRRLALRKSAPVQIVVCGGSALIGAELLSRTTRDVDVVALLGASGVLVDPEPMPEELLDAAAEVAQALDLPSDWLNNGPSSGVGGLFRMGLPVGLAERLSVHRFGEYLTVCFISRRDQIYFKLYAAVDRGGYHTEDLRALHPSADELVQAARWSMTHDVSEAYRKLLITLLKELGYGSAAENL